LLDQTDHVLVSIDSSRATASPPRVRLRVVLGPDERRLALSRGRTLVWRGRLDDRGALLRALPGSRDELAQLPDAELFGRFFEGRGVRSLGEVVGSWAAVVEDGPAGEAWLMRDPLGGRPLVYLPAPGDVWWVGHDGRELLVAAGRPVRLDPGYLATRFAFEEAAEGTTPLAGVTSVLPGRALRIHAGGLESTEFWRPPTISEHGPRNADELDEEARLRLREAVACRLADGAPAGILLSGGLDSVPIAAMARQAVGPTRPLLAFSWVFDRYADADERPFIEVANRALGLTGVALFGDTDLPLGPLDSWPLHPATPEQNPYRRLHERAYDAAAKSGTRVLLSGMCGDQLWSGGETWLCDSLSRGRFGAALGDLVWHLARGRSLRPAFSALAGPRRRSPSERCPWVAPEALDLLPDLDARRRRFAAFPRPHQAELLLGSANGHGFAVEAHFARRYGIELRYPMRDRRLVELMLGLPTAQIARRGVSRVLLRRALAGSVPSEVLARREKARFTALYVDGVYGASATRVAALVRKPGAAWRRFLRTEPIEQALAGRDLGRAGVLLWLALSLELWLEQTGVAIS
jgi:asparagine synthase (glutamine-hydrolysing)